MQSAFKICKLCNCGMKMSGLCDVFLKENA